jgi:hypothetical protein
MSYGTTLKDISFGSCRTTPSCRMVHKIHLCLLDCVNSQLGRNFAPMLQALGISFACLKTVI